MQDAPPAPDAPPPRASPVTAKWGEAAGAGFQLLPDVLLKNQSTLGLNATELVVLVNITMHWWYPAQKPFPRSTTIAQRMGVDARTVQRAIARLTELGLIRRTWMQTATGRAKVIDLDGLVQRLRQLAVRDVAYRPRPAPRPEAGPVATPGQQ